VESFVSTAQPQGPIVGDRVNSAGKTVGNKILLSIPNSEFQLISPHLEFLELPGHLSLHEPHEKQLYVHFLNRGLASIVVSMRGEREVEAGVVGYEGAVGTALAVGLDRSPLRVVVQIEGHGFRIAAGALQATLPSTPELQMCLNRYAVLQGMQVAQTAACNRLHDVQQRLARWLLMAHDRVGTRSLPITHDFLATMLGTDRPSVSLAAGILQQEKAIQYGRAAVNVLDREKLEMSACECYRVVKQLNGELGLK